jgi:putative transposase
MAISFKGNYYLKDVILYAVFFYAHYAVSCRDLEKAMEERCVKSEQSPLGNAVVKCSPEIAKTAQVKKRSTGQSCRMSSRDIALLWP